MAKRIRVVQPDEIVELRNGQQIPIVTEENLVQNVVLVTQFVNFAGGVLSLVVQRHPTDVPNEMVTTGAVIEWKDRTDAKAQPEPTAPLPQPAAYLEDAEEQEEIEEARMSMATTAGYDDGRLHEVEVSPVDAAIAAVQAIPERPVSGSAGGRNADDGPPPAASADGIGDGLEIDPNAEDMSEIPAEAR